MKPNRNMIAPCPFFPHDVGASDCGSVAFFGFSPHFSFCFWGSHAFTLTCIFPSRAFTGTTVSVRRRDTRACIHALFPPSLENSDARLRVYARVPWMDNKSVTHTREYVRKSRSGDQERELANSPRRFLVPRSIIDRVKIVTLAGYNLRAMRRAKLNESSMKRVESPGLARESKMRYTYVFNVSKVCET